MTCSIPKTRVSLFSRLAAGVLACVLVGGASLVAAAPQGGKVVDIAVITANSGEFDQRVAQVASDIRQRFSQADFPYEGFDPIPDSVRGHMLADEEVTADIVEDAQFYVVRQFIGHDGKALHELLKNTITHQAFKCSASDGIAEQDVASLLKSRTGTRFQAHNENVKAAASRSSGTVGTYSIMVRPSKNIPGKMTVICCSTIDAIT